GRLVGLVSAIFTKKTDANIGVNFAASMRLVLRVAEDLRDHGRVRRGKSGLRVEELTEKERATTAGARITRITPESAAAAAGLAVGDIITAMGGRAVTKGADVSGAVYLHRIGEPFAVAYLRAGEPGKATLTLKP
ncbi:MAG: serine protease, partial [Proteobacteria bacterium]|nr:serine protease [Pseudomonadota bacterium]